MQNDGTPIIFAQWDFTVGYRMRRRDFTLDALMRDEEPAKYEDDGQMNLMDMMAEKKNKDGITTRRHTDGLRHRLESFRP